MSFHLLAYNGTAATTITDIAPITDNVINIVNSHFFPQNDMSLIWATGMSANVSRVRISQPSLRLITLPWIRPLIGTAVPGNHDKVADYTRSPLRIRGLEELAIDAIDASGGDFFGLLALQDSYEAPPAGGDVYTLRGTSSTAAVDSSWTTVTVTWEDKLPDGVYSVIGLSVVGANAPAARLIFEGQTWRPGCIATADEENQGDDLFRWGRLGVWGRFRQTAMPQVQVLSNTTTSSWQIYLDIVKVG